MGMVQWEQSEFAGLMSHALQVDDDSHVDLLECHTQYVTFSHPPLAG